MRLPGGGFASSLDADSEHEEGLTYVWTWAELQEALGPELPAFASVYDASESGNDDGRIILNRLSPAAIDWLGDKQEVWLSKVRDSLHSRRSNRPQPARDDKVLADWNGLAISGLAKAAAATGNQQARKAALEAFRFVSESMSRGDRLGHSFMEGSLIFPGVATDYANMIGAALDVFAMTGEAFCLERAEGWFAACEAFHFDRESASYSLVAKDAPALIGATVSIADEATPAATGTMARNAALLFMLTGRQSYRDHAEAILRQLSGRPGTDVVSSASLQSAFDTMLRGRLAFVVGAGPEAEALFEAALTEADPALFIARVDPGMLSPGHPAYGKRHSGGAALFLCDALRCLPEIATSNEATATLAHTRSGLA
jgi:uncharacterized protein YyaL (SSP411 family)